MRKKSVGNVIFAILLLFSFFAAAPLPIFAEKSTAPTLPSAPDTSTAMAVYLYNFESDRAIVEKNMNRRIAPASTAKIASGLVAIEALSSRLDEVITVTSTMLTTKSGATLGLKGGDMLSVRDLLYASICGGYNDATDVLAYQVGGSHASFVVRLNQEISAWGMKDTCYKNATGMDEAGMYTTLADVVTLSRRAIENSLYMTISSAISYSLVLKNSQKTMPIYNRNALIGPYYYQGCQSKYAKGLIAGMTDQGGYCVATYAEYSGSRYLCVVMGAQGVSNGTPNSFSLAYKLLQHAFINCAYTSVAVAGDVMCEATVRLALPKAKEGAATVPCALERDLYALLPDDVDMNDLSFRSYLHKDVLSAPVKKGDVVGGTDVYYGDMWLCHARLIATEDVERNAALTVLDTMRNTLFSRRTLITLVSLTVMLGIYFPLSYHNRKKNVMRLDFRQKQTKEPPKPQTRPRR